MAGADERLDVEPWKAADVTNDPFMTHNIRTQPGAYQGTDVGMTKPVQQDPFLTGKDIDQDINDDTIYNVDNDPFMTHRLSPSPVPEPSKVPERRPEPERKEPEEEPFKMQEEPLQQQRPQEPPPEPIIPFWYQAENNWWVCKERMAFVFSQINAKFTGQRFIEQRVAAETRSEKAKDWLADHTGGRVGAQYEAHTEGVRVVDLYQDDRFPGDDRSYFRGGVQGEFSTLPRPYQWQRLSTMSVSVPYPESSPLTGSFNPHGGRVYQGQVEDFYMVAALQTLGMKPQLIANVFCNMEFSNPNKGLFMLRFYKHGQWQFVDIDDALPMGRNFEPCCCQSEMWPDMSWPSLIEKAYGKMHGSWEALGGGGTVEEVLTDLTGGCCTRFGTQDVANDRLWQYIYEMQRFCVFGCNINEAECGKRSIPIEHHWASSIYKAVKYNGVPYICVCCAAPVITLAHMPACQVPGEGHGVNDGFVYLRVEDFVSLFDTVYECRLVNSDLGPPQISGIPCSPGWVPGAPWFEEIWAFQGDVYAETAPSFLMDVMDAPNEITIEASTTDERTKDIEERYDNVRPMQAPLLVRFYQCSRDVSDITGGEVYLVHLSAWGHTRDATCGVKVMAPGRYLAMVSIPAQYLCHKMIFRAYTTRPMRMIPITQHRSFTAVNPAMPLNAIPYCLGGFQRVNAPREKLPQAFDEAEGRGKPLANPAYEGATTGFGTGWAYTSSMGGCGGAYGHGTHHGAHHQHREGGYGPGGHEGHGGPGGPGAHGGHGASDGHGGRWGLGNPFGIFGGHNGRYGSGGVRGDHDAGPSGGHGYGAAGSLSGGHGYGAAGYGHGGSGSWHSGNAPSGWRGSLQSALGGFGRYEANHPDGLKVVGKFGGQDAVATVEAAETQDGCMIM